MTIMNVKHRPSLERNPRNLARIQADGITAVDGLGDFINKSLIAISKVYGRDTNLGAHFGYHSLQRLIVAAEAVRYYKADIEPNMMKWLPLFKIF